MRAVAVAIALGGCGGGPNRVLPPADVPAPAATAEDCVELSCRACAVGEGCAEDPDVPDTCCAAGDALQHLAVGSGSEVVDAATDGRFAVMCGGFGAAVSDIRDPSSPVAIGGAGRRCQNAAFGPARADGSQVVYVTHHGDSWVPTPSLEGYVIPSGGDATVASLFADEDPEILFEGLAYRDGHLYVAAHSLGVLVYTVDRDGVATRAGRVEGFANAIEVELGDDVLYVVDRETGIHVLSLHDPAAPQHEQTAATNASPRDLAVGDGRVFVALGSAGIDVFDVAAEGRLTGAARIEAGGPVQQVAANADIVAAAAWSHVAVYDASTLHLLATERTRPTPEFEQDLGVDLAGDVVVAGEWEDMHLLRWRPGYVAPDLAVEQELLQFDPAQPQSVAVVVRNRGPLPLTISELRSDAPSFVPEAPPMPIPPGGAAAFEVAHTPDEVQEAQLQIFSNDPDDDQTPHTIPMSAEEQVKLGVGDRLTDGFAFLDLDGTGELANLEGQVLVLAYFALF